MSDSTAAALREIQQVLPALAWTTDPARVARLSQDFSWFSPVLKGVLDGKVADAAVKPRHQAELREVVSACAKRDVPITLRGGGTGNYGQATPLFGGLVIDLSDLKQFLWVRDGAARAQAGIRLVDFDQQARPAGWELRCMPSTFRIATLGGLFGGGFGGIGSINYGPLGSAGTVLGLSAMTVSPEPEVVELRGADALMLHHAWGTNGIVLEVELALAPAMAWTETLFAFEREADALAFANAVALAPGVTKKNICVWLDPIPRYLTRLASHLPADRHAVALVLAPSSLPAVRDLAKVHGGDQTYEDSVALATQQNRTLLEYTWNHTTLHALKEDKSITYLQVSFTAGQHLQQVAKVREAFGADVMLHLEFIRGMDGQTTCTALPLFRYRSEDHVNELIRRFREMGIRVNNPHVNVVEDGKFGGAVPPEVLGWKRRFDPRGLLNPGKLKSWATAGAEFQRS
ncbi:MAG TPA: FAD-binding oxidoreductase [Ramlibacter sp.]|nr:FAD-binding oxidoreductase [Ramlibacter sp.]